MTLKQRILPGIEDQTSALSPLKKFCSSITISIMWFAPAVPQQTNLGFYFTSRHFVVSVFLLNVMEMLAEMETNWASWWNKVVTTEAQQLRQNKLHPWQLLVFVQIMTTGTLSQMWGFFVCFLPPISGKLLMFDTSPCTLSYNRSRFLTSSICLEKKGVGGIVININMRQLV